MSNNNKDLALPETDRALARAPNSVGRSLVPLIVSLIFVALLGLVFLITDSFFQLDQQVQSNLELRAKNALATEKIHLQHALLEYVYWDESHDGLIRTQDDEFIDENITGYLFDTYGIELSIAIDGGFNPTVMHIAGERADPDAEVLSALSVREMVEEAKASEDYPFIKSAIRLFRDEAYIVMVGPFINYDTVLPEADGSAMLYARKLGPEYLSYMAERYGLEGLRMSYGEDPHYPIKLSLTESEAKPVGWWWHKDEIADQHFEQLMPFIVSLFLLLLLITWLVLKRDAHNRQQYTALLFEMASKDYLTGISNRREFFHLAGREMNRSRRDRVPISLLMLDVDHFKRINDSLGHEGGDKVLIGLTDIVKDNLRSVDLVARIGGEESCILLATSDQTRSLEVAERVREAVSSYGFPELGDAALNCTISIGLAVWDFEESLDELINRADEALYLAKRNGRNQVRVADLKS